MSNKTVSLLRYCKTPSGWRRLPVVMGGNNRVRPGWVKETSGESVCYPDGHYVLRFYVGSKVKYKPVGDNAQEALEECKRQTLRLAAREHTEAAGLQIVEEVGRTRLKDALDRFVQAALDRGVKVMADVHRLACGEFLGDTQKIFVDEITRNDFLVHQRKLRERGQSDRTIVNRFTSILSFAKFTEMPASCRPERKPRYEKKLVEIYSEAERTAFFAALTEDSHKVFFSLALQCGLRERELMFLQWRDIDFSANTLIVRSKPEWGFFVKDKEERSLSFQPELAALLQSYREKYPAKVWVTGTRNDLPDNHWLRTLKRIVNRAGLACGTCSQCQAQSECSNWYLHKFRATFATTLLRNGFDLVSVQAMMGHSDLESTMRYLRPQENTVLQARMNTIVWA